MPVITCRGGVAEVACRGNLDAHFLGEKDGAPATRSSGLLDDSTAGVMQQALPASGTEHVAFLMLEFDKKGSLLGPAARCPQAFGELSSQFPVAHCLGGRRG